MNMSTYILKEKLFETTDYIFIMNSRLIVYMSH